LSKKNTVLDINLKMIQNIIILVNIDKYITNKCTVYVTAFLTNQRH